MTQMTKSKPKINKKGYRFLLSLNEEQKLAKAEILENDISIVIGKAGSGKTLLACQIALQMILENQVRKIIITRPTVSKEDLGYLPGKLEDKMDPWVAPIYGNMYQLLRKERVEKMIADGLIEIVPVSYMRGRTFTNSCIIVDEAQNVTHGQSLMILQRIGVGSRMIFCGDTDQIDLKNYNDTGLKFLQSVNSVKGLHTINLLENHRHPILDDVLDVYEKYKYHKGL
jgi:phosphate starvation-inducible PhoH-like protein|tara:strand:- start:15898 stop:16578 length:681 start_codon:yes stop_codon:yes gene_type:complete